MLSGVFMLLCNGAFLTLRLDSRSSSFPRPLTAAEEREYVQRWSEGDIEARNLLIEHNLRLVAHITKKYYASESDAEDLISIGTIGLIKGITTYRPEKGVRLATYASRCIENEVLMYFRSQRKNTGNISLSDSLDPEDESGALSLLDILCEEDDMADRIGSEDQCRALRRAVFTELDERERKVLVLRYGLDGKEPRTQRETAKFCSISRSYVSRIEKKALEKLRNTLED